MFPKDPHRQYQVKAPKVFPQHIMRRIVRRDKTKREANLFRLGARILSTDEEFEFFEKKGHYVTAFKIFTVDSIEPTKSKHKPLEKNLKDAQKMSINCKYVETKFDTTFKTFKEAIAKKEYVENKCWLDTILDVYGNTLMAKNKREVVNRGQGLENSKLVVVYPVALSRAN